MFFQDDSAIWDQTPVWVHWIFDEQLQLLLIYPDMHPAALSLWKKVLKAVEAKEWLAFFEGDASVLQAHRMIYHEQSILGLVHQLSPQHLWVMGDFDDDVVQTQMIQSAPPQDWFKSGMKKNLWLNWLKILKK
jgi:hypothetical protein